MVTSEVATFGLPSYRWVELPHPFGERSVDEVHELAASVLGEVVTLLTTDQASGGVGS